MVGSHVLKSWAKTQSCITLSSAESEAVAIVKAACEGIAVQRLSSDLWRDRQVTLHADATAALAMAERNGLGKARHIDTGVLWLQQRRLKEELEYAKVLGTENVADLMTNNLEMDKLDKYFETVVLVMERSGICCCLLLPWQCRKSHILRA